MCPVGTWAKAQSDPQDINRNEDLARTVPKTTMEVADDGGKRMPGGHLGESPKRPAGYRTLPAGRGATIEVADDGGKQTNERRAFGLLKPDARYNGYSWAG